MLLALVFALLVVAFVVVIAVCCSVLAHDAVVRRYGYPPRYVVNLNQPQFVLTGRHPAFREIEHDARTIPPVVQTASVRRVQEHYEIAD